MFNKYKRIHKLLLKEDKNFKYFIIGLNESEYNCIQAFISGNILPCETIKLFTDLGFKIKHVSGIISIRKDECLILGETKNYSETILKFCLPKNKNNYYYNYGRGYYDYFGAGLEEPQAMWETIVQVIYSPKYALIFKCKKTT